LLYELDSLANSSKATGTISGGYWQPCSIGPLVCYFAKGLPYLCCENIFT
jgi:hypothetical protein